MQISSYISLMALLVVSLLILTGLPACSTASGCDIPAGPVSDEVSIMVTESNISENTTFQSIDPVLPSDTVIVDAVVPVTPDTASDTEQEQNFLTETDNEIIDLSDGTTVPVLAATNTSEDTFDTLYKRGLSLIASGDYEGALPVFADAVASDLSSDAAWTRYGETHNALGDFAKGYAALKRALDINEENKEAWYGAAIALAGMGRFEEAIPALKTSFSLMPDNPDILNDLGVILDSTGRYDEAIVAFKGALDLVGTRSEFWNNLGVSLFHQGRYYESIGLFSEALSLDSGFTPALYNKAAALEALGHDEEALAILTTLQDNMPDNSGILYEKAVILEKMGRYEEADETLSVSHSANNITPVAIPETEDLSSATAYITITPASDTE